MLLDVKRKVQSSSQAIGTAVLSSFTEHSLHPSQNSLVPSSFSRKFFSISSLIRFPISKGTTAFIAVFTSDSSLSFVSKLGSKSTISRTRALTNSGDFFLDNQNTNLYSIIEKAAQTVCGGEFKVRDVPDTYPNDMYYHYNVDRKKPGDCQQCHKEHTREHCTSSLKSAKSKIADIYTVSISCFRYKPKAKGHKYRKVFTIIKIGNIWNIQ